LLGLGKFAIFVRSKTDKAAALAKVAQAEGQRFTTGTWPGIRLDLLSQAFEEPKESLSAQDAKEVTQKVVFFVQTLALKLTHFCLLHPLGETALAKKRQKRKTEGLRKGCQRTRR